LLPYTTDNTRSLTCTAQVQSVHNLKVQTQGRLALEIVDYVKTCMPDMVGSVTFVNFTAAVLLCKRNGGEYNVEKCTGKLGVSTVCPIYQDNMI